MFSFLCGSGWVLSQSEMIENGAFTKSDYQEFAELPILKMFPGRARAVIYFADTGARMGGACALDERMLQELREQLGEKNVVVK